MMKKINFLIIPLITIIVAVAGSMITSRGMDWYHALEVKPSSTPPDPVFGIVWTILFILQTVSALIFWNIHKPFGKHGRNFRFWLITIMFLLTGALNVLWSFLFFGQHLMFAAVIEAIILGLSVLFLAILLWPLSKWAASLLVPYILWVFYASYLTLDIWSWDSQLIH